MATIETAITVALFLFSFIYKCNSLLFTLSAGTQKCMREEVHKDILVTGEYKLSDAPIKTHLTVRSFCFMKIVYVLSSVW